MRPRLRPAFLAMLGAAVGLNGCSYIYDVEARVIAGRLAIVSLDEDFECVSSAYVTTEEKARAAPAANDDRGLIANAGAFWWVTFPNDCEVTFPLRYGQSGIGAYESVRAKPLQPGTVYDIRTSGTGGYGFGRFRITPDRRVENLPHSPGA